MSRSLGRSVLGQATSFSLLLIVSLSTTAPASAANSKPGHSEKLMIAAGFTAVPANTPAREAEIATLKPKTLVAHPTGDGFTYVYADPKGCACLYMGDAADYADYQKLAAKERIADANAEAAADLSFGPWNWSTWGPYDGWGWSGGLFLHHGL